MRLLPSNRNGRVTMPTVSAPASRASSAMIGAAPVPVPPPMPQVTNTMSAPCSALEHLVAVLLDGLAPDLGPGAGAESAGELLADLDLDVGLGAGQRLRVGVDRDELHALEVLVDHAVDGVAAAAADADHLHPGVLRVPLASSNSKIIPDTRPSSEEVLKPPLHRGHEFLNGTVPADAGPEGT